MSRVQDWLHGLGLDQYGEQFAQHRIGFDVLPELTDPDLEKLQIPLGDRKRLLRAIAGLEGNAKAAPEKQEIPGGLERRPVTVLFIDLTDYTHLHRRAGARTGSGGTRRARPRIAGVA